MEMIIGVPGVYFRETMTGHLAFGETDPVVGARSIRRSQATLVVDVTLPDPGRFEMDPGHSGVLHATLDCPHLGQRLERAPGSFRVAVRRAGRRARRLTYEVKAELDSGEWALLGYKEVRNEAPYDLWTETTTLYTVLRHRGPGAESETVAAGILNVGAAEFTRVMRSVRPIGLDEGGDGTALLRKFGELYAGELWTRYASPRPSGSRQPGGLR
jgi:cholesterol oxidase